VKSEFVIYFSGADNTEGDAVVVVSVEDLAVLRYEVLLYSLPSTKLIGHEVTANFFAPEIQNKGVFYTDSNALEMQKRTLNFRPTWDISTYSNLNITANYYPIQSAIAIVDSTTNMQMLVMNSRSQGGSVLQDGQIELMQNRRLNKDDWRGMGDPLNEVDSNGNGVSVPATYYV